MGLFSKEQLSNQRRWVFKPLAEAKSALEHDGIYPMCEIAADRILPCFQGDSLESFRELSGRYKGQLVARQTKDERVFAAKCLRLVYEQTICAYTAYNPEGGLGLGSPLLVSSTPSDASTGYKGEHQYPRKESWPEECSDLPLKKIRDIFCLLGKEGGSRVIATLDALCEHVIMKSGTPDTEDAEMLLAENRAEEAARTIYILESESDEDEDDNDDDDSDNENHINGEDESESETEGGTNIVYEI